MLKSLLGRVKSEKTASRIEEPARHAPQQQNNPPELWDEKAVTVPLPIKVGSVPSVCYCVVEGMPDLTLAIESCALPFHELPFSKRRVKEVDLDKFDRLPAYLSFLLQVFSQYLYQPNHFLINDYPPAIGILPHFDGPAYHPEVLVYSIGTAIIEFSSPDRLFKQKLLLEDRSLHLFSEEAYTSYLHGINDYGIDCVFMQVKFDKQGKVVQLLNCSVSNLASTKIYREICSKLVQGMTELILGRYELTAVLDNPNYNYKLEVQRARRISITIRHKYRDRPLLA